MLSGVLLEAGLCRALTVLGSASPEVKVLDLYTAFYNFFSRDDVWSMVLAVTIVCAETALGRAIHGVREGE